jgi:predicted alpha/beta superfamily hydrolase
LWGVREPDEDEIRQGQRIVTDANQVYRMSINQRQVGWGGVGVGTGCLILTQVIAAASLFAQPAAKAVVRGPVAGAREALLTVNHVRVPSKAFNTVRDIYIWQPDAESPTAAKYPVLVFPDAEETGQFRAALANVQFLIDRQLIPPMIVVGVPYLANRTHELSPKATGTTAKNYPNAGGADQTLQFIVDELLPWVDARYPTMPVRILAGHSLGGLLALYAMDTRPDAFRIVIAISPGIFWNDGALGNEIALRLATDTVRPRTLFVTSGGQEAFIDVPTTAFAARMTALLDSVKTNHQLRYERRQYPRDAHSMTPLPSLVDGLRMAFEPMLVPADSVVTEFSKRNVQDSAEIKSAVDRLESRYAAGSAFLGIPGVFPEEALDLLGSYALQAKQANLAGTLFRENRDRYPSSSNAHESVGEALVAVGDTARAVEEFRSSVALAKVESKSASVLVRAQARAVTAAAQEQLQSLHAGGARDN